MEEIETRTKTVENKHEVGFWFAYWQDYQKIPLPPFGLQICEKSKGVSTHFLISKPPKRDWDNVAVRGRFEKK